MFAYSCGSDWSFLSFIMLSTVQSSNCRRGTWLLQSVGKYSALERWLDGGMQRRSMLLEKTGAPVTAHAHFSCGFENMHALTNGVLLPCMHDPVAGQRVGSTAWHVC